MTDPRTLDEVYLERAIRSPDALALTTPDRGVSLTWSELATLAEHHRDALRASGAERGSRVGVVFSSSQECIAWCLAVWMSGATVLPIDRQWGTWLRSVVLDDAEVHLTVEPTVGAIEVRVDPVRRSDPAERGSAFISYTSGSTGRPKGAMLGHSQVLDAYALGAAELNRLTGGRPRRFGSLIDASGLGVLGHSFLWPASMGCECVILPPLGAGTLTSSLPALQHHEVDFCYLVPPLVALLARAAPSVPVPVRTVFGTGGAPLSASLRATFEQRFETSLLNFYGLTEVSFTAFFGTRGSAAGDATASVGRPGTVVARLRGSDGEIVHESPAEGVLEITGPSLAIGYHQNAAEWRDAVHGGWLVTGDVAMRDEAGEYTIIGRGKEAVMVGGDTIYLGEVEAVTASLDGVAEVAAIRLRGADHLEAIGLVVRLDEGCSVETVRSALLASVGRRRTPDVIHVTSDPLPRVGQGKLDRHAIRDTFFPDNGRYGD